MPSAEPRHPRVLDLEDLESDNAPLFVIRTGELALEFDFLFCNEAFRKLRLRDAVLAQDKVALLFRSWAQALGDFKSRYDFDGRVWHAEVAGRRGDWKIVRADEFEEEEQDQQALKEEQDQQALNEDAKEEEGTDTDRAPVFTRSRTQLIGELKRDKSLTLNNLPSMTMNARWESIQSMMEMSDVGVFEYNAEGKLLHANEAWYRLRYVLLIYTQMLKGLLTAHSLHPRSLPDHVEFSFMDLVYPEDQAIVMSMWNKLAQGKSVTFEMRWIAPAGTSKAAQWVLSACVPVFDDNNKLIAIAGNTIDIGAQKRSQEAAQEKVEALEQVRLAEMKFTRFAQLSPTAIFVFVPELGWSSCRLLRTY
jgi:PAS domain-containing protein